MGPPPDTMPGQRDAPWFGFIRRLYFYDPQPALRQLRVPTLGIWGELDGNVMAEKNKAAWEAALSSAGNRDYTLRILPKANHMQLLAKTGSNREMPTLRQFVPEYFSTIQQWLAGRTAKVRTLAANSPADAAASRAPARRFCTREQSDQAFTADPAQVADRGDSVPVLVNRQLQLSSARLRRHDDSLVAKRGPHRGPLTLSLADLLLRFAVRTPSYPVLTSAQVAQLASHAHSQ